MKVDVERCELVTAPPGDDRFEAVRERLARVWGGPRRGHEALRHAVVECRTHELVDGRTCERCEHFLNAVPVPAGDQVRVRCVLFETDTVETLMTPVDALDAPPFAGTAGARLPVVPRTMGLGAAARALRAHDLDVLGVIDRDELIGVITRDDLRRAGVPGV